MEKLLRESAPGFVGNGSAIPSSKSDMRDEYNHFIAKRILDLLSYSIARGIPVA